MSSGVRYTNCVALNKLPNAFPVNKMEIIPHRANWEHEVKTLCVVSVTGMGDLASFSGSLRTK